LILHTTALNYKLIKKIKDERFDEDQIHHYFLLVHLGTRDLQVSVIDARDNRVLVLEDYVFPSLTSHGELLTALDQLFDAHAFLRAAFWKQIKVSVKNNKFVQVPQVLFIEEAQFEYLKYNAYVDLDEEDVLYIENHRSKAVTIFAIQKDLKQWFLNLYPNNAPIFMHQSAVIIEGVTQFLEKRKNSHLYIYVDRFKLHILSFKQGNLLYYNQFVIKQFSDYIKYIMLVMKSLNLDQRTSQVMLWGYIGKNSQHYNEFYKYINNVVFGHRPVYINFAHMFDEVQDHHFFDLFSMHLLGNVD
jgi:hypothetical protein